MKLSFAYYGNPILRKKAKAIRLINDEVKELITSMIEVMDEKDGVGLAAPQVNYSLKLFIIRIPIEKGNDEWEKGECEVFINPKILKLSVAKDFYSEGCLSIPGFYKDVLRPITVKLEATDLTGNQFIKEFTDLHARVILHEYDHLNGILFIDHLDEEVKNSLKPRLKRIQKKFNS